MARTQNAIYTAMLDAYVAKVYAETGITIDPAQWSLYDLQQYLLWTGAGGQAVQEQLFDQYKVDINDLVAGSAPQSAPWFQAMMFKFQYNATTPQVLVLDPATLAWEYPTVDANLRPIAYCSVVAGTLGTTVIKIADSTPAAISSTIVSAAQSYVNVLAAPGLYYNVVSLDSDKIYMALDVYYIGQYSAVIQANVIAAIDAYFASIPFNGVVMVSNLEAAIKAVTGVSDVVFKNIQARANTTTVFSGTDLVNNFTLVSRQWQTVAGYCQTEPSPNSLTDTRPDGSGLNNLNLIAI